jgi:hypothetical protein
MHTFTKEATKRIKTLKTRIDGDVAVEAENKVFVEESLRGVKSLFKRDDEMEKQDLIGKSEL